MIPEGSRGVALAAHARAFEDGGRALLASAAAAGVGLLGLAWGLLTDPRQALFSYLVAVAYLLAITLGALGFLMAVHAAGAVWPTAVRRLLEAVVGVVPLFFVLFLPLAAGAGLLYPWIQPEQIADPEVRHLVEHKRPYLYLPFMLVRTLIFLAFWTVVAELLRRWSLRFDDPPALAADLPGQRRRLRILASAALPAFGLSGTIAAWDWLMSLTPEWFSTMFGLNYLVGGLLGALALLALLALLARRGGYLPGLAPSHFYGIGRLLFAFLIFWAYTWYWQYFLIWIANRPLEVQWFLVRTRGPHGAVAVFLIVGHFALPFFILLSYWVKRRAWALGTVAAWLLASRYLDVHWIVAGARGRSNPFSWLDLAALLAVGGLALALAVHRQRGRRLAPVHDPAFLPALEYHSR